MRDKQFNNYTLWSEDVFSWKMRFPARNIILQPGYIRIVLKLASTAALKYINSIIFFFTYALWSVHMYIGGHIFLSF